MNEQLKHLIDRSDNIVFFGGAGVSTESGIPDFRSENGLFSKKFDYPPEKMLSYGFFRSNPKEFYDFYRMTMICKNVKPNAAHLALAKLEEMGKLKAVITQNIDGLHQIAGSKTVYELHGTTKKNHCYRCGKFYEEDFVSDCEGIPYCSCGGVVKPDVVLYGEALDRDTVDNAIKAISKADLLIVAGTSLMVHPAAGLIEYFNGKNIVLINKSETPYDNRANLIIRDPVGETLKFILEQ